MKRLLLLSIFSIFCLTISAQTNTWTGGGTNNNWNTVGNWSLFSVPTAAENVVIPTGFTVNLNVVGTTKSISVKGNSTLNIANSLSFTNASSFAANTTIIFSTGNIKGGGTLTNNGTINFTTGSSKYFYDNTILNNLGTINFSSAGVLYINDGTINNQASGVIDLQTAGGNISYTGGSLHKINNYGLIKRTSNAGDVNLGVELHNDGGTISVETGGLNLNFGLVKLTGGIYNVSTNASLNWLNTVTCSGTLIGSLNGQINWSGIVSVPVATTFNFVGSTGVNWTNGSLKSGGTLTNMSKITMLSASSRYIYDNTIVKNEGVINFESTGVLYVNDGTINNQTGGLIDLKSDGNNISYTGGATHTLNNYGTIKRTVTTGTSTIGIILNNNAGTISVEKGILDFVGLTKNLTNGTYNVASNSSLLWNSKIVCAQSLVGALNGQILWNSEVNVPGGTTTTFNFSGSTGVNWANGSLSGGGTLNNLSEITLLANSSKYIYNSTTLNNEGDINFESTGVLYVNDGTINNKATGVIYLKSNGNHISYTGGSTHELNNSGLIKSTVPTGASTITIVLNNNNGIISVESGVLNFVGLPKYLNDGVYNLADGTSLKLDSQTFLSGSLTGILDGEVLWNNEVHVLPSSTVNFDFTGTTGVNWANGSLNGGGTLVNKSEITMLSASSKYIYNNTKLNNEGIINFESNGVLYINDGTINNQPTGLIDLMVEGTSISYTGGSTHTVNNYGLLKRSTTTGASTLVATLNNIDGSIEVKKGVLNFSGLKKNLTDGTYDVSTGSAIQWNTEIVCVGTMEGVLDGSIEWNNIVSVDPTTTATFNFTGDIGINWTNGSLGGGGTLNNAGEITLLSNSSKYLYDSTILNNEGIINYESVGVVYVNDGIINNKASGVIDLISDGTFLSYTGGSSHVINNLGLLKKSTNTGSNITVISIVCTNSGIINIEEGELRFSGSLGFNNTLDGVVKGVGTIGVPPAAAFTNNGIFAPGGNPGTLTVNGNFKSSTQSRIQIEIYGETQETEYDLLDIQGTTIMDGTIEVELGYAASLNDEFVILTTNNITSCNLPATVTAHYDNYDYTFNVVCGSDNVTLKISNITLGTEENTLNNLSMYPNPSNGNFTINLGKEYTDVGVQIYNMLGQVISSEKFASAKTIEQEINTVAGVYFVKISTANEGSNTLRIIKN